MAMTHSSFIKLNWPISIIILLIALLTGTSYINPAAAQVEMPFFRTIGTVDGLSNAKVNCIMQDKRGFLWFGTEDGLNRYDGKYFTVFTNQPNDSTCVSGNIITDLHEDSEGVIWIATADGGLTRYNYHLPALKQFKQFKHNAHDRSGIPENNISKIAEDRSGNLWLATSNNIIRFNKHTATFDIPLKPGGHGALSLTMVDQDTLWAGNAEGGILKINTRTLRSKTDDCYHATHLTSMQYRVMAVFKDTDLAMWYGEQGRDLYYCKQSAHTLKKDRINVNIPGDEIVSLAEDTGKNIWIASRTKGLALYNKVKHVFISYRHDQSKDGSLVDDHVNAVYIDRNGILWVGTDNGICIHDPVFSPFHQYYLPKRKKDIEIYDFYKDANKKLWIATNIGIFIKRQGSENYDFRQVTYKGRILEVSKFFKDRDGTFYLGTNYTLFMYNPATNKVALLPNTASDPVMKRLAQSRVVSIVRDTINRHPALVVSTYGHFLTYYDFSAKHWISRDYSLNNQGDPGLEDHLIKKFYKDSKGILWLATVGAGLGAWQQYYTPIKYYTNDLNDKFSISSNNISDMQEDLKGNLWVSTYGGGLNYFNTEMPNFIHIKESSNLTEGLQSDMHGNIWMICSGHFHEYDPLKKIYSCYDIPDLKKNGGVKGYIYKDAQHNLYAGGTNFYVLFNPASVRKIKNDPDVYFTDFKVFNTSYSQLLENRTIHLNHSQNYFSLEFSAPAFSSNHIHYDYMLEGVDKEWVEVDKNNQASYSNLPGGIYRFKVRACNWKGSFITKFSSVIIIISPPYWQQWWFYITLIMIIALLVYFLYQYRVNELIKRQSIRNDIAQDLHDHIGSTLSSISIYSKVAKIYQEEQNIIKLRDLLSTIGETASETINEMSDIVWTINPKNDHMNAIIQKIKSYAQPLCVAQNIVFDFNYDNKILKFTLDMETRKNFFLILKESLNNAIKHANCSSLLVSISLRNDVLELTIKDNGIGFIQFADNGTESSGNSKGNGLANLRARADELHADLTIHSEISKGTKVMLNFKIK